MLTKFFFDVADVDYIKDKWNKIKNHCDPKSVIGVTTNPGIWNKAGIKTFSDMNKRLVDLCKVITEIRGDDKGVVYTQPPYSDMPNTEIESFIKIIKEQNDGCTKVGCKLPPYIRVLKEIDNWKSKYDIDFNVTGISDCSTALMSASYNVRYISIIPGRMEEVGIDAETQIRYVLHSVLGDTEIITGAMRTVECLHWVCQLGTVPTIGTRVWDNILDGEHFVNLWLPSVRIEEIKFSPVVNNVMRDLSVGFFKQMDELGQQMYKEFKEQI